MISVKTVTIFYSSVRTNQMSIKLQRYLHGISSQPADKKHNIYEITRDNVYKYEVQFLHLMI